MRREMINALHLLWIIPISASFGAFIMALMVAAKDDKIENKEKEDEA
jgi:hypothetical protein